MTATKKTPKTAYLRMIGPRKFQIRIYFTDNTSKSFNKTGDEKLANEVHMQVLREIYMRQFDGEKYFDDGLAKTTLEEFMDLYVEFRRELAETKKLSHKTVDMDYYALKRFLACNNPKKRIGEITDHHITMFDKQLLDSGYSPKSINDYNAHLKGAFTWAIKKGFIKNNPYDDHEKLGIPNNEDKYLEMEDIEKLSSYLLNDLNNRWAYEAMILALNTGIRRESLLRMKREHIFSDTIDGQKWFFLRVWEKGRKEKKERDIPLVVPALEIISRRLDYLDNKNKIEERISYRRRPDMYSHYRERSDQGYLFFEVSRDHSVSQHFRKAALDLNIKCTFHSFRHSAATYMYNMGVDKEIIMLILGHEDIKTTSIYSKLRREKLVRGLGDYRGIK